MRISSSVVACSIWVKRKIQSMEDLRLRYISVPDVALCIMQLLSLAFVPVSDVVAAFDELVELPFFRENEEMVLQLVTILRTTGWATGKERRTKCAVVGPCFVELLRRRST